LGEGEVGPHLTQCGPGEAYLHAKFRLDPSNHLTSAPTLQTDRTDRQRTDSIGRTVLQTVAQKQCSQSCYYALVAWCHAIRYLVLLCVLKHLWAMNANIAMSFLKLWHNSIFSQSVVCQWGHEHRLPFLPSHCKWPATYVSTCPTSPFLLTKQPVVHEILKYVQNWRQCWLSDDQNWSQLGSAPELHAPFKILNLQLERDAVPWCHIHVM